MKVRTCLLAKRFTVRASPANYDGHPSYRQLIHLSRGKIGDCYRIGVARRSLSLVGNVMSGGIDSGDRRRWLGSRRGRRIAPRCHLSLRSPVYYWYTHRSHRWIGDYYRDDLCITTDDLGASHSGWPPHSDTSVGMNRKSARAGVGWPHCVDYRDYYLVRITVHVVARC